MRTEYMNAHAEYTRDRADYTKDRSTQQNKKKKAIDPTFKDYINKYSKENPEWKAEERRKKSKKSLYIHQPAPTEMQL